MQDSTTLSNLRSLLNRLDQLTPKDRWSPVSGSIGLLLEPELRASDYDETPRNSAVFAQTGGDGVHFSFLQDEERRNGNCPVVMTVPMNWDNANLIVGRDLKEFLALGVRTGYVILEQLLYDRSAWLPVLDSQEYYSSLDQVDIDALKAIQAEFKLEPWVNHGDRLEVLQNEFF